MDSQRTSETRAEDTRAGAIAGEALVVVRGASKRFNATQALDHVDLDLRTGSILALLGQNGAGKSTLIRVLAGLHPLDGGEVTVCGHPLGAAEARGSIAFVHQELGLVAGLSVAENVTLGNGYPRRAGGWIAWREARARAQRALAIVGCAVDPRTHVADLSRTERSLVAIARNDARSRSPVNSRPGAALMSIPR